MEAQKTQKGAQAGATRAVWAGDWRAGVWEAGRYPVLWTPGFT